jgi:hypothetical protein
MSDQRAVGIRSFVIEDVQEKHGPPSSPVLHVQLLPDNVVSLSIEKYDEDNKKITLTRVAQVIVDIEPLCNGLNAAIRSEGRKAL